MIGFVMILLWSGLQWAVESGEKDVLHWYIACHLVWPGEIPSQPVFVSSLITNFCTWDEARVGEMFPACLAQLVF